MTVPKLILQGDKREGKKWIHWAKEKLRLFKSLSGSGIVNQVMQPVSNVRVQVMSVNAIDSIRIAAEAVGRECKIRFESDVQDGSSPLAVQFTSIPIDDYTPSNWFWRFGDTKVSDEENPLHTYDTPGTYTVTLRAWNNTAVTAITGNLFTYEHKNISGVNDATAFANFMAAPWTSGPYYNSELSYYASKNTTSGEVTYVAQRISGFGIQAFGGIEYLLNIGSSSTIYAPLGTLELEVDGVPVFTADATEPWTGRRVVDATYRDWAYTGATTYISGPQGGYTALNPANSQRHGFVFRWPNVNYYFPQGLSTHPYWYANCDYKGIYCTCAVEKTDYITVT